MEISPYLQAFQSIEGQTPGDKHRTLNITAIRIAAKTNQNSPLRIYPSIQLPKEVVPWVKLAVADILERPEEVASALHSEDVKLFNRALKVKWFFTSNIPHYSDADFFVNRLLPDICLKNRLKIIRTLRKYLRSDPQLAETFYEPIAAQYGYDVARPLLLICNESFLWGQMMFTRTLFNVKELKYLYKKCPNFVINYLKKSVRENTTLKSLHDFHIDEYKDFLPMLVKNHCNEFMEFIDRSSNMGIRLSHRKTKFFWKFGIDAIYVDPLVYLPMLTVKYVHRKLDMIFSRIITRQLFCDNLRDLDFDKIEKCLEYIPLQYRASLISITCIENYGSDWTQNFEKISPAALRTVSLEDRIQLVRRKLEIDQQWYIENDNDIEKSWRCYLPVEMAIHLIRVKMARVGSVSEKLSLMRLMLLTCEINNSPTTLLRVFNYITSEFTYSTVVYTEEEEWKIMDILLSSINRNSPPLQKQHWNAIYSFIDHMKHNRGIKGNEETIKSIIVKGIQFDLKHDISIKSKIRFLTDIYQEKPWLIDWNIIKENPEDERACLKAFSNAILKLYLKHYQNDTDQWKIVCVTFLKAIYNYNRRHPKMKKRRKKLSIRKFPWLLESIQKIHQSHGKVQSCKAVDLVELDDLLRCNEPDVLLPESRQAYTKKIKIFQWTRLQYIFNPQPLFRNYKKFYEECRDNINKKSTRKLLRFCRWHQEIPIKVVELALEDFKQEERNYNAVIVLSILLEGREFERFVSPFIPEPMMTTSDRLLKATLKGLQNINSMVSTDLLRQICSSGIDNIIIECLGIIRIRMGANRVTHFCKELSHQYVNLFKHSIDAIRIVTKLDDVLPILEEYWEESKQGFDVDDVDDKNKRFQLVRNMLAIFETKPSEESWGLVDRWLNDLSIVDEPRMLRIICMYEYIPTPWLGIYLEKVLITIRRLANESVIDGFWRNWYLEVPLFDSFPIEVARALPTQLQECIISGCWDIAHTKQDLSQMSIKFFINSYILTSKEDELEERLNFFGKIFKQTLNTFWNIREPRNAHWNTTMTSFLNDFTKIILFDTQYSPRKKSVIQVALDTFMETFRPSDDPKFFTYFYFSTFYDDTTTADQYVDKICDILPTMYGHFPQYFTEVLAMFLHKLIKNFYPHKISDMIYRFSQKPDRNAVTFAGCLLFNECRVLNREQFDRNFDVLRMSEDTFILSRIYNACDIREKRPQNFQ